MGKSDAGKPPPLPRQAPPALQDFVACRTNELKLDVTTLDWLPKGPLGDFGPDLKVEPGDRPGTAKATYGMITFPAKITDSGELSIDTSAVPDVGPLSSLRQGVTDWVDQLNAVLKHNDKRLEKLSVAGGKLVASKAKLSPPEDPPTDQTDAAPTTKPAATTGGRTAPATAGTQGAPPKAAPGPTPAPWYMRLWKWIVGILVLGLVLLLVLMLSGGKADDSQILAGAGSTDDGDQTQPSPVATPEPTFVPEPSPEPTFVPEPSPEPTPDLLAQFREVRAPQDPGFYSDEFGFVDQRVAAATDATSDVSSCQTSELLPDRVSGDVLSLIVTPGEDSLRARLEFGQPVELSRQGFSWAGLFGVEYDDGFRRAFIVETHDGVDSHGEILGEDIDPAPVEITIEDSTIIFEFDHRGNQTAVTFAGQAFNTPSEEDAISCDELIIDADTARPAQRVFTIDLATNTWNGIEIGRGPIRPFAFGPPLGEAFRPFVGDWNGDGAATPGFFNPLDGSVHRAVGPDPFGLDEIVETRVSGLEPSAAPVVIDIDGDGIDSVLLYVRTPEGVLWYDVDQAGLLDDANFVPPGIDGQIVAADFDGDGRDSFGAYHEGVFSWGDTNGESPFPFSETFGEPGDQPLWLEVGDGGGTPAVWRASSSSIISADETFGTIFGPGFEHGDVAVWSTAD